MRTELIKELKTELLRAGCRWLGAGGFSLRGSLGEREWGLAVALQVASFSLSLSLSLSVFLTWILSPCGMLTSGGVWVNE